MRRRQDSCTVDAKSFHMPCRPLPSQLSSRDVEGLCGWICSIVEGNLKLSGKSADQGASEFPRAPSRRLRRKARPEQPAVQPFCATAHVRDLLVSLIAGA